jgi:hypothetical protein
MRGGTGQGLAERGFGPTRARSLSEPRRRVELGRAGDTAYVARRPALLPPPQPGAGPPRAGARRSRRGRAGADRSHETRSERSAGNPQPRPCGEPSAVRSNGLRSSAGPCRKRSPSAPSPRSGRSGPPTPPTCTNSSAGCPSGTRHRCLRHRYRVARHSGSASPGPGTPAGCWCWTTPPPACTPRPSGRSAARCSMTGSGGPGCS